MKCEPGPMLQRGDILRHRPHVDGDARAHVLLQLERLRREALAVLDGLGEVARVGLGVEAVEGRLALVVGLALELLHRALAGLARARARSRRRRSGSPPSPVARTMTVPAGIALSGCATPSARRPLGWKTSITREPMCRLQLDRLRRQLLDAVGGLGLIRPRRRQPREGRAPLVVGLLLTALPSRRRMSATSSRSCGSTAARG